MPTFFALFDTSTKSTILSSEDKVVRTTRMSGPSVAIKSLKTIILPGLSPKISLARSKASPRFVVVALGLIFESTSNAISVFSFSKAIKGVFSAIIMLFLPLSTFFACSTALSNLEMPFSFDCIDALTSRIITVFSNVSSYFRFTKGAAATNDKPKIESNCIRNNKFVINFWKKEYCFDLLVSCIMNIKEGITFS